MKFLLFADFHYAPGIFMGGTPEALAAFQKRAEDTGSESSMFIDIGRAEAGCRVLDAAGRPVVPRISSFEITL